MYIKYKDINIVSVPIFHEEFTLQVLGPLMVYGFLKASCAQVIAYIDKLAFGRATLIHTLYARCKSFLIAIDPCCFSRY